MNDLHDSDVLAHHTNILLLLALDLTALIAPIYLAFLSLSLIPFLALTRLWNKIDLAGRNSTTCTSLWQLLRATMVNPSRAISASSR